MNKTIIFNHLGFPIKLVNWPHILVDEKLIPDVNYKNLEELMFSLLPSKPSKLTGAEIKFIRHHLNKTQKQFAAWLGGEVSESIISVWEKTDLEPTKMASGTETKLRLEIHLDLLLKRRRKTLSISLADRLKSGPLKTSKLPISIDASKFFPIPSMPPVDELACN